MTRRSPRPLRPGDAIRVGRGFPLRRVDEDAVDFLRVHYETASPGLARVIEVTDTGMLLSLWSHRFHTDTSADDPHLKRLGPLAARFAPERLGEALLAREVRLGRVCLEPPPRRSRQPVIRTWLRRTRGRLPILEALGGRVHPPVLRRCKAGLFHTLARFGLMPAASGFLDHGLLIDRIGRVVTLTYGGDDRQICLDRILLHKNHTIHLIGIDLAKREQRAFRLDRVQDLEIPPLGGIGPHDLWLELQALCMSREGWRWYWNKRQAERGLPPAPPLGPLARAASWAGKVLAMRRHWWRDRLVLTRMRVRHHWWNACRLEQGWFRQRRADARALWWSIRPPRPKPPSPALLSTAWRRRLCRAIATVEAGVTDQVTGLLPMNALLADPFACHAWLRHMLERTLEDAETGPPGHPLAPDLLAEALSLVPLIPAPPLARRRAAALALYARLLDAQPGHRRVSIHATRRAGWDSHLLLCEAVLQAVYWIPDGAGWRSVRDGNWPVPPDPWFFYRANAHFIARWDDGRFRVDAASAPRLRETLAWWNRRLLLTPPPVACRPPA